LPPRLNIGRRESPCPWANSHSPSHSRHLTLGISQLASRTWRRLPEPMAVVSCRRCGAPGKPGPVCKADADTVIKLPEGSAAKVKNRIGADEFGAVDQNSRVVRLLMVGRRHYQQLPAALSDTSNCPAINRSRGRRLPSGAGATRFLHRPCTDRHPAGWIRNPVRRGRQGQAPVLQPSVESS
jgi:hypothetical protein